MKRVSSIKEYIECIEQIRLLNKRKLPMVFRGQGNSSWKIKSTLERVGVKNIFSKEYYRSIDYLKPEINSLGHHFKRNFNEKEFEHIFSDVRNINFRKFPDIEYLSYLRHHGFPTPLIDVTQSEYVALFFACEDMDEETNAKVFVFREDFGCAGVSGSPQLEKIGHYFESDRRHIAQQSEYLLALQFQRVEEHYEWIFIPFSSFLEWDNSGGYDGWDVDNVESQSFFEIEIEGCAKKQILAELYKMNINHYTLYLDEDSLIRKLRYEFLQSMKND